MLTRRILSQFRVCKDLKSEKFFSDVVNRPVSSAFSDENTQFAYVGRKIGKTHYYEAYNQHLKELGKYVPKEDRDYERHKGRGKALKAEQYDAMQVVRRKETGIRVSYLKLNLVAKLIRGLTVREAVAQLTFSKKKHAKTALQVLSDACREAQEKFALTPDQLELDQIFVNKGLQQKRIRIMGKGRTGLGYRRWSHLNIHLREIDFDEKIRQSKNEKQARNWMKLKLQVAAMADGTEKKDTPRWRTNTTSESDA